MINQRRYEIIDLVRRVNSPDEIINKRFYTRKEMNKPMYKGNTTECDSCQAKVKAKENGKPQWRQDGFKPDGKPQWRMIDLDDETHDCRATQARRDEYVLEETKKKALGISPGDFEETITPEEIKNVLEDKPNPQVSERVKDLTGVIPDTSFQSADVKFAFDRTFKIIEGTVSVTRKVGPETIAQIPQYETLSFLSSLKIEMELGADIQRVLYQTFGECSQSIAKQIEEARVRLSGM